MLSQKNILILTSRTGGGHVSLAEALRDLLIADLPPLVDEVQATPLNVPTISLVDPQPPFFHLHYRLVSRYALPLWAAEFQFFDTPRRALLAHRVFTRLVRRKLSSVLDEVQPELILTTYPFLTYEVARLLERRSSRVPLVLLFSDANGVHASWLSERRAAATLATTRETYAQALAVGFAPERLHQVGWPVRAQFTRAAQTSRAAQGELRVQLGLAPERFTIFLQGGGEGAAHVERAIKNMLSINEQGEALQIILATGTNRALQTRYQGVPGLAPVAYTREIASFMAAADVIMGKAGPNMLFEAVTLGKPFIATTYIPGQEEANLAFIQRYGLGWVALKEQEQRTLLTTLTHEDGPLTEMRRSIDAYSQWNAAGNQLIVPVLRELSTDAKGKKDFSFTNP